MERRRRVARTAVPSAVWLGIVALLSAAGSGCASRAPGQVAVPSYPLASLPRPTPPDAWPIPPDRFAEYLIARNFDVISRKATGAGTTGAEKARFRVRGTDTEFTAKWKEAPGSFDGFNNSPRKELATYEVQRLFLDPDDYAVPISVLDCVEVDALRKTDIDIEPNFAGADCVVGLFSQWIDNVTLPDPIYDPERFRQDGTYALRLANFNLLTYLVEHRDNRTGNFLVSIHENDRRVFAIDNGITFGARIFNWFVPSSYAWSGFEVPALPRASVERLRRVTRADLDRQLGVVSQLELDDRGRLVPAPLGENLDPSRGVRTTRTTLQMGLTGKEIDGVERRLQRLLRDVDAGRWPLF